MTAEKKRKIVMDHVIRILRNQMGGNHGIHNLNFVNIKITEDGSMEMEQG